MLTGSSSERAKTETGANNDERESIEASIANISSSSCARNVRVVTRIRPLSSAEKARGCGSSLTTIPSSKGKKEGEDSSSKTELLFVDSSPISGGGARNSSETNNKRPFEFDAVFHSETSQEEVYTRSGASYSIRNDLTKGFNVTILAYGQTGSGKTFTMGTSTTDQSTVSTGNETIGKGEGVIPRAVHDLFEVTEISNNTKDKNSLSCQIQLSYMEIYNEEIRDLLKEGSSGSGCGLQVRDTTDGSVCVVGLTSHEVTSPNCVHRLMELGSSRRVTASTAMNSVSSRSHSICTLKVTINPTGSDSDNDSREQLTAKLTLVDLAGSERIKRTGAEGARMQEGININKGLFVLGQVISSLSDTQNSTAHIPYRDSKLTRILQDSLGGNSCTIMIACVSPANDNVEESTNTLRYAERARNIKNSAIRNTVAMPMSIEEAMALRKENKLLKLQLMQMRSDIVGKCQGKTMGNVNDLSNNLDQFGVKAMQEDRVIDEQEIDNLDLVVRLRTKCLSLENKLHIFNEQIVKCTNDCMSFSQQADKWHRKYKKALQVLEEAGIILSADLLETAEKSGGGSEEICELKLQLAEAEVDARMARATAAAVINAKGDLDNIEVANDDDELEEKTERRDTEKITSELALINGSIEQKEELSLNANKEFRCILAMHDHFQSSYDKILEEKTNLENEREVLFSRLKEKNQGVKSKHINNDDKVGAVKMKERIGLLEDRIKCLREKATEHKRVLRMRDDAQKKCERLGAELANDKRRKAALQRKIQDITSERKFERIEAKRKANAQLREGNRLKMEVEKVRKESAKQIAFLRRKASEALAKQNKSAILQNKRKHAAIVKGDEQLPIRRQNELSDWIDQEINTGVIIQTSKGKADEQNVLRTCAKERLDYLKSKKNNEKEIEELKEIEKEIEFRTGIIHHLQKTINDITRESCKRNISNDTKGTNSFTDLVKWQSLSRSDQRFITALIFQQLVLSKIEISVLQENVNDITSSAISKAVFEEKQQSDKKMKALKISHSKDVMAILETTQGAMEQKVQKIALGALSQGLDNSVQNTIDTMLNSYFTGCKEASEGVRNELKELKSEENGIKQVAENFFLSGMKKPKKAKKIVSRNSLEGSSEEDIFDSEDLEDSINDDEDSDWTPTPNHQRKRKKFTSNAGKIPSLGHPEKNDVKKMHLSVSNEYVLNKTKSSKDPSEDVPFPVIKNHFVDDGRKEYDFSEEDVNKMKVAELREILRKLGLPVSGRKHELIQRILKLNDVSNDKENICKTTPPRISPTIRDNSFWQHSVLKNHSSTQNILSGMNDKRKRETCNIGVSIAKRKKHITASVTEKLEQLDQTVLFQK